MTPQLTQTEWDLFIRKYPQAHLLQTLPWGQLKSEFGWQVEWIQVAETGAQILFRKLPFGFSLAYIPKGPVGPDLQTLLPALDELCKQKHAFLLKIEPDAEEDKGFAAELESLGFIRSLQTIQPRRTLIVDLEGDEDEVLARMSQKTRYNVRLADRKGVVVRAWQDIDAFGQMIHETALRDSFGAHTTTYYQRAFELFNPNDSCELLVAEFEGTPLSAIMVFCKDDRAWYFFGASTELERNRMPTYLLQWEAMRWARDHGCKTYDLWGVPDHDLNTLEQRFTTEKGGLWGVYRFKRGFGGELVRSMGAWDRVYNQALYHLYRIFIRSQRN